MQDFRAKGRHFRRFFKSDNVNAFAAGATRGSVV
jgi:hypothetical protein